MLNSKELLERTGISRATLNNYISWGIVPRPDVLPPEPADGAAPRIGYFPEDVIHRIAEIQRLKRDGWSMKAIAEHFKAPGSGARAARSAAPPDEASALLVITESPAGGPQGTRRAELSHVAVLAADLHDAARIWCELPAEEYFELIDQVWLTADPIFRRHHGIHGKHPADGLVCYFFPRREESYLWDALAAAHELREGMRRVSKEWQLRKLWTTELYLNIGLDEGQQWMGTSKAPGQMGFTMLGPTLNRAARISDFARHGAIWASKHLTGQLAEAHRQRLKFGVRRKDASGREVFVESVYGSVDSLLEVAVAGEKLKDIARLPITEIVEIHVSENRRERELEQRPA